MFPSFLPSDVEFLTESTSISLAQSIERYPIVSPLTETAIATTYVHQGSGGIPILLLHGFDSSVFEFRRLLPRLAAQNETWVVDLLGFGFTDRLSYIPVTPATIKTHLYYFWKTLIQQPIVLVGVSMGGAAALDFTLSYPESVQKLVLIDSAGFAKGREIGKFMFPPLGYLATQFLRSPKVRKQIGIKAYYDRKFSSADADLCAALHLKMSRWNQGMIEFTKSGGYNFLATQIPKIARETLILWGRHDQILGTDDARKFEQAIAHSKLIWIPDCGHVPHLEKPEETAQNILEFARV